MSSFKRILVMKPSSLGDVVHAIPTVGALRNLYPDAQLTWFVKRQWAGLLNRVEGLDHVWPVDSGLGGWLAQIPRLRAARFDLAVDLQGLFRSGAMIWLAGCPTRIGFANAREGSPWFYTHKIRVPSADMHAVDRYLLVSASLGGASSGTIRFSISPTPDDQEKIEDLFRQQGIPLQTTLIGMNVSARWMTKRWPPESFAALADRIQKEDLARVVLLGGPEDDDQVRSVKGLMNTHPLGLTGALSLELLPALLESVSLLVTNDSGPMHIAAAVGTPVVAIFGPTSPNRTGPYGDHHQVLAHKVPCSPCFSRTCHNHVPLECLAGISPSQVMDAVHKGLAMRLAPRP